MDSFSAYQLQLMQKSFRGYTSFVTVMICQPERFFQVFPQVHSDNGVPIRNFLILVFFGESVCKSVTIPLSARTDTTATWSSRRICMWWMKTSADILRNFMGFTLPTGLCSERNSRDERSLAAFLPAWISSLLSCCSRRGRSRLSANASARCDSRDYRV